MKHNISIIEIPEGEESEQGIENLFEEIMNKNFLNLVKEKKSHKSREVSNKLGLNRSTLRHIIIKITRIKDNERVLKALREKQVVTSKGAPIRPASDYLTETFQYRRE